ncbi:hypothetical protein J2T09_004580 [Neorhizobium huautlense]|uniref:Uncharacterized protein n=1 Tax=Neorhizobium huautlense TaxID=67774 RepID=A0ABT9PZ95_9HYPH|nr:hypothetical protein [Neorhizobium huautlense]MDP9839800.1 hypothetical protein [Neorhizobium huautlense]
MKDLLHPNTVWRTVDGAALEIQTDRAAIADRLLKKWVGPISALGFIHPAAEVYAGR